MRFKGTEIATMVAAGLALIGAAISGFYTYANRNRELDIRLVEIGIGILRADPKETNLKAARGWAVQVIEDYSKVKFSEADRAALLEQPLLYRPATAGTFYDDLDLGSYGISRAEQENARQLFEQLRKRPTVPQPPPK
jgi:hypothetical protein